MAWWAILTVLSVCLTWIAAERFHFGGQGLSLCRSSTDLLPVCARAERNIQSALLQHAGPVHGLDDGHVLRVIRAPHAHEPSPHVPQSHHRGPSPAMLSCTYMHNQNCTPKKSLSRACACFCQAQALTSFARRMALTSLAGYRC